MNRQSGILIGILAGVAAGLMALAAMRAGAAALLMLFAAPMAVYIASLGWGTLAGLLAAITGAAISSVTGGVAAAVSTAALLFLPAAWGGHLANLAQPDPEGDGMIWYPLDRILVRLMIAIVVGIIVTGAVLGYDAAAVESAMVEMLREILANSDTGATPDDETLQASARLYTTFIPLVVPAAWLALHVVVFHLSALIAERSGRLARPRDDIPASAGLPFELVAAPAAGLVAMAVAPSPIYEIGAILAGVGITGFTLVGLAQFHLATRGRPGRGLLLFSAYLLIFLFTLPMLIFAAMGIARAWRNRAPSPPSGGGPPAPNT